MTIQEYYVPQHMKALSNYYALQAELEQQAIKEQALRIQFENERAMELSADNRMEMDMERESYEC